MQKRYQVFVSSTFDDLQEERAEVMQALLELDCIPAGMELFPAANEEQWDWIKKVIDDSDYYLVIVAGRYGQTHPDTNLSYTEMEYRYAIDTGKPVVAFIHDDTGKIPMAKSEQSKKNQKKLNEFMDLCKTRLCKFWANSSDLGAKVSRSVTQLIRHNPAPGWVRASDIDEAGLRDLERLRLENQALQQQVSILKSSSALSGGIETLKDGSVELVWELTKKQSGMGKGGRRTWRKLPVSRFHQTVLWKDIVRAVFPHLISENFDMSNIRFSLSQIGDRYAHEFIGEDEKIDVCFAFDETISPVRNKFLALGLIEITGAGNHGESWKLVEGAKEMLLEFLSD